MGADRPLQAVPLTAEQEKKLAALLAALDSLPTPEAIVQSVQVRGVDWNTEEGLARCDAAMAGAWAYDRMLLYLDRLRSLNEERIRIGEEIRRLKQHPYPTTGAEVEEAASASVMAPHLAGKQEIVVNFFCVSVQHIRSLLKVVADAVGYVIPQDDLDYLDEFRFLRNHFEHWYNRLPGKPNEGGLITRTVTADGYHVRGGLETDENDRVVVIDPKKSGTVTHVVDVTNDGVSRVERIVQETVAQVRERILDRVRSHFMADPGDIPSPEDVRQDLLIGVGGDEPKPSPEDRGPPENGPIMPPARGASTMASRGRGR